MHTPSFEEELRSPHAALFARLFREPELAWVTLCALLPPLTDLLERDSLRLADGHLVSERLVERFTDLLFEARLRDDREVLVWLLFEHKSWADRHTALQVLTYAVELWRAHQDARPPASSTRLPLVLPVVLLHDPGGRSLPARFSELYDGPPALLDCVAPFVPDFGLLVDDLRGLSFEAIAARSSSPAYRLAAWLLRSRGNEPVERLEAYREAWSALLDEGRTGAIGALLRYAAWVGADPDSVPLRAARAVSPRLGEEVMNNMERLLDQGRTEGRVSGKAEGRAEGMATLLTLLLQTRFGTLPDALRPRLARASEPELERWTARAATASALEEVFDELPAP
jgi:hypothetical protein